MESLQMISEWKPKMIVLIGKTPMYVRSVDNTSKSQNERLVKQKDGIIYYSKGRAVELRKFPKAEKLGLKSTN